MGRNRWFPCGNNSGISFSGPYLKWDNRKCSECGEIKYTCLRAFTLFVKPGCFWKEPSLLAKRINGIWFGWDRVSGEFDNPLHPIPRRPTVLCSCAGPGGRISRRAVLAEAKRLERFARQIQDSRRRRFQYDEEHNVAVIDKSAGPSVGKWRVNIGGFGDTFGREGIDRYGIERSN